MLLCGVLSLASEEQVRTLQSELQHEPCSCCLQSVNFNLGVPFKTQRIHSALL